jgi:putative ABC transport system permease protein
MRQNPVMLNDLRYALRILRRSPGFAASAILALALGIGANTAVFSVVYAVLLKPLPFEEPDRLVRLSEVDPAGVDSARVSIGTFVDWRARSRTLEAVAVYTIPGGGQTLWSLGDRLQVVRISAASPALFAVLRSRPVLGRTFHPEDLHGGGPSADRAKYVLSYDFWQRAFGGAASVIGQIVSVEGRFSGEIIGVMPPGFAFPEVADVWASLPFPGETAPARRRMQSFNTIARLRPGVTLDQARAELQAISAQLASEQPASNRGWTARVVPQAGSDTAATKPALLALLGAVAGVLVIGCASVANLLLARTSSRRREMAVRLALGAGTLRLVRQCLAEALVLAAAGSLAAVLFGHWLAKILVRFAPPDIPRLSQVGMSPALLAFAAAAGLGSAVFTGLAPALQVRRADRDGGLRPESRASTTRGGWVRRALIAVEVGLVVLLLTGALLLVRTFVKLRGVDLGFQPQHVLNVSTRWPVGKLFPSTPGVRPWPSVQRAVDGLIAAVSSVPGVDAVGLISDVPLTGDPFSGTVWRADAPGASGLTAPSDVHDRWQADLSVVSTGFFPVMGVPILRGRHFTESDRSTDAQLTDARLARTGVLIVNNVFASRYFPGQDPIGRTLVVYDDQEFGWSRTIVGVVGDIRGHAIGESARPAVYIPHAQHPDVFVPSLLVRSTLPPDALAKVIRERIAAYDPALLVQRIRPMDDVVSGALSRPRFNLVLLSAFALVALALSAVGIYGVLASLVAQRTREIGIRVALGARGRDVVRLVVWEGMAPVIVGAAVGIAAAALATRALRTLLFGVTPLDPVSFAAAPALLAIVALLACYLPARRATRVDPLVALREE